ncbi:MAG: hypothetical protein ACHQ49_12835 [Elusimicrobiota bacterium]
MSKFPLAGPILTATVVAFFSSAAAALTDASQASAVVNEAKSEGFAASETAAARVAQPKSAAATGQASVAITSFIIADNNMHVGEICGRVTGSPADDSIVRLTVDPSESKPAIYNALADRDGAFCAAVVTFTGRADASVKGMDKPFSATATAGSSGR